MNTQQMAENLAEMVLELESKAYAAARTDCAKALKRWGFTEAAEALADTDNEL